MCKFCNQKDDSFAELKLSDSFFERITSCYAHIDNNGVTTLRAYTQYDVLIDKINFTLNYCPICGRALK